MSDLEGAAHGRGVYGLEDQKRNELAAALAARGWVGDEGLEVLRIRYPQAPQEMLETAAHHLYVDGPRAAIDFLAEVELSLRDPEHEVGHGPVLHLLYHVYNWLQFRPLIPEGSQDVLDLVKELRELVDDDDFDAVKQTVEELEQVLGGFRSPPEIP